MSENAAAVILCGPPKDRPVARVVQNCPVCKQRRRMVVKFMGVWYAPHVTCCGCGDTWAEGELLPRPFVRAWRRDAIGKAKALWPTAMSWRQFCDVTVAMAREEFDAARSGVTGEDVDQ